MGLLVDPYHPSKDGSVPELGKLLIQPPRLGVHRFHGGTAAAPERARAWVRRKHNVPGSERRSLPTGFAGRLPIERPLFSA